MKRQRRTIGSIVEINIDNEYYCYAQLLDGGSVFFDYLSSTPLKKFDKLLKTDILFIIRVYDYVITKGIWKKVGKIPIRKEFEVLPMKFIQDNLNPDRYELYNPNTGEIKKTTKDKVIGLERSAVWANNHVEDRLRDYYYCKVKYKT